MAESKARATNAAPAPKVEDRAVDLPENTEAAATEAAQTDSTQASGDLQDVNPATTPGDNLPANGTLTENPAGLPGAGTGYHCGICGQPVGAEGQHYDGSGDVVTTPHANTMVVADDWPTAQAAGDQEAAQAKTASRTAASRETKTENNK
jgi:hypothetical protein